MLNCIFKKTIIILTVTLLIIPSTIPSPSQINGEKKPTVTENSIQKSTTYQDKDNKDTEEVGFWTSIGWILAKEYAARSTILTKAPLIFTLLSTSPVWIKACYSIGHTTHRTNNPEITKLAFGIPIAATTAMGVWALLDTKLYRKIKKSKALKNSIIFNICAKTQQALTGIVALSVVAVSTGYGSSKFFGNRFRTENNAYYDDIAQQIIAGDAMDIHTATEGNISILEIIIKQIADHKQTQDFDTILNNHISKLDEESKTRANASWSKIIQDETKVSVFNQMMKYITTILNNNNLNWSEDFKEKDYRWNYWITNSLVEAAEAYNSTSSTGGVSCTGGIYERIFTGFRGMFENDNKSTPTSKIAQILEVMEKIKTVKIKAGDQSLRHKLTEILEDNLELSDQGAKKILQKEAPNILKNEFKLNQTDYQSNTTFNHYLNTSIDEVIKNRPKTENIDEVIKNRPKTENVDPVEEEVTKLNALSKEIERLINHIKRQEKKPRQIVIDQAETLLKKIKSSKEKVQTWKRQRCPDTEVLAAELKSALEAAKQLPDREDDTEDMLPQDDS